MCLFLHHSSWNFLLFKDDCVEWNVTELDISIIDDGNELRSQTVKTVFSKFCLISFLTTVSIEVV